ncbi:MAG TPA: LysR substrate-binding domain-containing protein [Xanthomonadales bacterium]
MRLRHIEVFHAVYTCGSVTRAAEVLKVSQPSISKVLAHAEQQLGFALFTRVRGKLLPTPEANQLFVRVAQVNDGVDRLRQLAAKLRSVEKGTIRIAATPAFGIDFLPGAIASYRALHGDIMFSLETLRHEELSSALLDSRIDIGLAFDPGNLPGINGELLGHGRFVVIAPANMDLGHTGPLKLEDLIGLPFISLDNQGPLDRFLTAHIEAGDIRLNSVVTAGSYQLAKAFVAQGVGVCIADEVTARSGSQAGVTIRKLEPTLRFRIAALHKDHESASLVCREFIDHLKHQLKIFLRRRNNMYSETADREINA